MMRRISRFEKLFFFLLWLFHLNLAFGQRLPGDAAQLLPALDNEISTYWPTLTPRAFPAMVIDQESGWKSKATLRTAREFGCGLGQTTITYNADGSTRFDTLTDTKRLSSALKGWDWKDCYNVQYQLRAVVLKLKVNERNCLPIMAGNRNVKACGAGAYNGGFGSVTKRIRSCRMTRGCIPDEWFNNLEKQCPQANVKVAGYGESFCEINSRYPGRVEARQYKFKSIWPKDPILSNETKK